MKGQSLIEATIALGVITTGLVGALTLVSFSLRAATTSQNRLIALNLSWEGIEVAQNTRDGNYLEGVAFNTGLDGGGDQTAIVDFDANAGTWTFDFVPSAMADNATQFYNQGGVYRQSSAAIPGIATNFRRLMILDNSTPDQVRVVSSVQWREGSATRQVSAERIFYDWR